MSIGSIVGIASTGLGSIARQLAVVSQNVANASTPGYSRQHVEISAEVAGGDGIGVRVGLTVRSVDVTLQAEGFSASAQASGRQVTSDALAALDAVSGQPGGGANLPSLLGSLRDAFSALSGDPSNLTQQGLVVDQAAALARGLNAVGQAASHARQAAQDSAGTDVATANDALRSVGALSIQIQNATSRGDSTAQLEDQRDAALAQVSDITGARIFHQPNGDVLALAGGWCCRRTPGPVRSRWRPRRSGPRADRPRPGCYSVAWTSRVSLHNRRMGGWVGTWRCATRCCQGCRPRSTASRTLWRPGFRRRD